MAVEEFDTPVKTVDRWYRLYREELRVFFKRRSRKQPAEDLVHQVFLRLLNYPGVPQIRDPRKFLYKIAWRLLYTENRRLKYEPLFPVNTDPEDSKEDLTTRSPLWDDDSIEKVDDLIDLERALGEFRPEQRNAFLLYWRDRYSYEETSAITGINIHTVRKYVPQVMLQLRKQYSAHALVDR